MHLEMSFPGFKNCFQMGGKLVPLHPGDYPYGDEKEYDYFGPTDYDYEPFGAISGTYAVAVSLIFLEQISLNGGSITII